MDSVNEIKITYRNEIMYRAVNRLSTRGGKGGRECIRHDTRHFPQVIRLEVISEFTQQDSRKKRTAKRYSAPLFDPVLTIKYCYITGVGDKMRC